MTYLLDRVLKFRYYTHSDHNEVGIQNPVDEVHIEANFSSKLPVADARVHKPFSNSHYYNVYVPRYVGFSGYPMYEDAHVKNSLSDRKWLTFTNFFYKLDHMQLDRKLQCIPRRDSGNQL